MRARNIKPGFYKNEDLAECSVWARFIFPGLWMMADREGRLEDRPKRIQAELLPFDAQPIEKLLTELADRGFILRYQNEEGRFIQISKFKSNQSPHYSEKASVIKPPENQENDEDISPQNSENYIVIKRGSQPPDSLIPDLLTPDSPYMHEAAIIKKPEDAVFLPVVGGDEVYLTPKFFKELETAYPVVDVSQTLREMRAWCIANPAKCKTPRGITRFVNRWMEREQNRG